MKSKKQLQKENEWRRRTGHAYAENLEKIPVSEKARHYWKHRPYGIGDSNEDLRTDKGGSCEELESAYEKAKVDTGQVGR